MGKDDQVHPLEAAVPENQPLQLLDAREGNVHCPLLFTPIYPKAPASVISPLSPCSRF